MGERLPAVVRRLRLRAGLTQEELAARSGVSVSTIRGLETGQRPNPRLASVRQLAEALELPPGEHEELLSAALGTTVSPSAPPQTEAGLRVLPRQLPAAPAGFTGRAAELARLTHALDATAEPSATVVVTAVGGMGGIGKTALALHWAHHNADRFPDGQLFVNLRGFDPTGEPMPPASAVRGFLDTLGVALQSIPADLDAQVGLYRSLVADKRLLIVLDNARDAAQVTPLLPGSPTCTVIVTSRDRLTGLVTTHNARPLALDVLDEHEARVLLARRLGQQRLETEPEATAELLAYCAGLPLALSITAGRAQAHPHVPLAVLAGELHDTATRLSALDADDPHTNLDTVLSWSYHALTAEQAEYFRLLGIAPGADISLAAAATLLDLPVHQAKAVLRTLQRASLLDERTPGRYHMHDLTRLYATEQAHHTQPADQRDAALRRLVDFYLHTAHIADRLLYPHGDPLQLDPPVSGCQPHPLPDHTAALAWFDTEHANLLATLHTATTHGWHQAVWQLASTLHTFHLRRGHLHDALVVWRAGLAAARRLPDPAAHTRAHRLLGYAYARLGRHDEAIDHLHHALALAERHHDPTGQADTRRMLAWAWEHRGELRRALEHATHALHLYRTLDLPVREAEALNTMGWYVARLGDHDQARTHCQAALALHRRHRDRVGEAATLDSLGYLDHHTGHHHQAIDHYQQALTLFRYLGFTYQVADTLDGLGHPHAALGQHDQARTVWRETLELYRQQGRDEDAERVQQQLHALDKHPDTSDG